MSKRRLALAPSTRPVSHPVRGRRQERQLRGVPTRKEAPVWTDLEEAFFAAAPPDVPEPAAEAERFDDLDADMPASRRVSNDGSGGFDLLRWMSAMLRRLVGAGV